MIEIITKKRDAVFGRYPCCDMINNAIRLIHDGNNDAAIEELFQVIQKAGGYLHEDLKTKVNEAHQRVWEDRYY